MIARLHGTVEEVFEDSIIIDVNGIGFEVFVDTKNLEIIEGNKINLYIYTNIYNEGVKLYGFKTKLEMRIFKDLIKVSKIGPKTAFNIVSSCKIEDLISSIKNHDMAYLTSIKGIGKKAAERILIELSEKDFDINEINIVAKNEAIEALVNLGFDRSEVYEVVKNVNESEDVELILKTALKELGK